MKRCWKMKKTNLGKSFYTTYAPSVICKELHGEFHLPYAEVVESASDFPDFRLVTVIVTCYEKDSFAIQKFLNRFDSER